MSAPYTFLNFKLEDALKAYIESADNPAPPLNIYRTCEVIAEDQKLEEPFLTVACTDSGPVQGIDVDQLAAITNQSLACVLIIRTHAANEGLDGTDGALSGRDYHAKTVGRIMDLLYDSELVAHLNAAGVIGIGIQQVDFPRSATMPVDRSYETRISFAVHAYATSEAAE